MGYNDLPPEWVFDFFHWLIIAGCFAPFVLAIFIIAIGFIFDCLQRGPCCPTCGQPWHS